MTVLVTGVYGFIGFSVAKKLLEQGHTVIGLERLSNAISEKKPRQAILEKQKNFKVFDIDLTNFQATKNLLIPLKFDTIVHLAGQYSKAYSEEIMLRFIDGNVRTWMHLMHIAYMKGIKRVVYASSTFVPPTGITTSMYGATLMFREIASPTYNKMGIETVAIRYSTTYGPYMRADSPAAQVMSKIYKKRPINAEGGGFGNAYSWVYIDDAVEITLRSLTYSLPTQHVCVTACANDTARDLETCTHLIEQYSGIPAIIQGTYPPIGIQKKPHAQLEELQTILQYNPAITLPEGIKDYVSWYLKTGKEYY